MFGWLIKDTAKGTDDCQQKKKGFEMTLFTGVADYGDLCSYLTAFWVSYLWAESIPLWMWLKLLLLPDAVKWEELQSQRGLTAEQHQSSTACSLTSRNSLFPLILCRDGHMAGSEMGKERTTKRVYMVKGFVQIKTGVWTFSRVSDASGQIPPRGLVWKTTASLNEWRAKPTN